MRVMIACEFSGIVRDAFLACGHDAISCDILPTEAPGPHIQDDIRKVNLTSFDLLIAHPPCTHLASSGARWFSNKLEEQQKALEFVRWFMNAPVARIAIENPIGIISTSIRKSDQIIQPYEYGHGEVKTTCLWLKNLPPLHPTSIVDERVQTCWKLSPSQDRWKLRSKTYPGIVRRWPLNGEVVLCHFNYHSYSAWWTGAG